MLYILLASLIGFGLSQLQSGRLLLQNVYSGSCSTNYQDDFVYDYQQLGGNQLTYVAQYTVLLWLNVRSTIPNQVGYSLSTWSHAFLLTDVPASSYNNRLLSLGKNVQNEIAFRLNAGVLEFQVATSNTAASGLGPTLQYATAAEDQTAIMDNWVFVKVSVDYTAQQFLLSLYHADAVVPFLTRSETCADTLLNCAGGQPPRPYLYRNGLKMYAGCRGASVGATLEKSLCGRIAMLQTYPNVLTIDPANMNFVMWGANQYPFSLNYLMNENDGTLVPDSSSRRRDTQSADITWQFEDSFMRIIKQETEVPLSFVLNRFDQSEYKRLDWGRFTLSVWIFVKGGVITFAPLKQAMVDGTVLFSISLTQSPDKSGYTVAIIAGVESYYSATILTALAWHHLVLSFYTKPLSSEPTAQFVDMILDGELELNINTLLSQLTSAQGSFYIGDSTSQAFDENSEVYLSHLEIFDGAGIITHTRTDSVNEVCQYSIANGYNFVCLQCQPGFAWDYWTNSCVQGCHQLLSMPLCSQDCVMGCSKCKVDDPGFCLECVSPHVADAVTGACVCVTGFSDTCDDYRTITPDFQMNTYFSFGNMDTINTGTGVRQLVRTIYFDSVISSTPAVFIGVIYLDVVNDAQYQFEVINPISILGFTLRVTVRGNTLMKNFGIKYLAYLALPKFPMFKSGQIPLDNTTPLGTGTGTRIYTDEIPIVGWPTYYNPPKVMLSILGIEINSGTQCSLKSVASAITGTSFTMEVTATDDSTYLSLLIGWVAYADIFEQQGVQFTTTAINQAANNLIDGQSRYTYQSFTLTRGTLESVYALFYQPSWLTFTIANGVSYQLELQPKPITTDFNIQLRAFSLATFSKFTLSLLSMQMKCSAFKCKICGTNPFDCLACLDGKRTVASACVKCRLQYFELAGVCTDCPLQCTSCPDTTKCSTCDMLWFRNDDPTNMCPCMDGYFEIGTSECSQCANKCLKCSGNAGNCNGCAGSNRNTDCGCSDKLYDDLKSADCQHCQDPCLLCDNLGCLSCKGNRKLKSQLCECPNNGAATTMDSNYCNSCLDILVDIQLLEDLTTINITFSQPVAYVQAGNYFLSDMEVCSKVVDPATLTTLGTGPSCNLAQNSLFMLIKVGDAPTFVKDQPFVFLKDSLKSQSLTCFDPLSQFELSKIQFPLKPIIPKAILRFPLGAITICEDFSIEVSKYTNDGRRGFGTQEWSLISSSVATFADVVNGIITDANSKRQLKLDFKSADLVAFVTFTVKINVVNFLNSGSETQATITVYKYQKPTINIQQASPLNLNLRQALYLTVLFSVETCNPDTLKWTTTYDNVIIKWSESLSDRFPATANPLVPSAVIKQPLASDVSSVLTVPPYTGSTNSQYLINAQIYYPRDSDNQLTALSQINVNINLIDLVVFITGGDRVVYQDSEQKFLGMIWDPNQQDGYNQHLEAYNISWTCSQLSQLSGCIDRFGDPISNLSVSNEMTLPEQGLTAFDTYIFTMVVVAENINLQRSVTVFVSDIEVPVLNVYFPGGILQRKINLDEPISFALVLPQGVHPDQANFAYSVIRDNQIISQGSFFYPKFRLQVQDFIGTLTQDTDIYVRLSQMTPGQTLPSSTGFNLQVNAPPRGGKLTVLPKTGKSMSTLFKFSVSGWTDDDNPIEYRFMLYTQKELYLQDIQTGMQSNQYDLSEFSSSTEFETQLPSGNLLIVCQVKDTLDGFVNVTAEVTVSSSYPRSNDLMRFTMEAVKEKDPKRLGLKALEVYTVYSALDYDSKLDCAFQVGALQDHINNQSLITSNLKRLSWRLQGSGAKFLPLLGVDQRLGYLEDLQNQFRQDMVHSVSEMQKAKYALNDSQDLGDFDVAEKFERTKGYVGDITYAVQGSFKVLDEHLGRLSQDIPQEYLISEEEAEESTSKLKKLLKVFDLNLSIGNSSNRLLTASDEAVLQYRKKLKLTPLQQSRLHTIYSRIVNMVHLIGDYLRDSLTVNGVAIITNADIFDFYTRTVTLDHLIDYLPATVQNQSVVDGALLEAPPTLVYNDQWTNIEDLPRLTQSEWFSSEEHSADEMQFDNNLNMLMWEQRDSYQELPNQQQAEPGKLFHINIVKMRVNPYYWWPSLYSYSRNLTYSDHDLYVSPQITQFSNRQESHLLNVQGYRFATWLPRAYTNTSSMCVSIVTNFSADACVTQVQSDRTLCYCDYVSDVALIPKWIPPHVPEVLPRRLTLDNMPDYTLGQVIILQSLCFILFMLIAPILDHRHLSQINKIAPDQPENAESAEKLQVDDDEDDEDSTPNQKKSKHLTDKTFDQSIVEDGIYAKPKGKFNKVHDEKFAATDEKYAGKFSEGKTRNPLSKLQINNDSDESPEIVSGKIMSQDTGRLAGSNETSSVRNKQLASSRKGFFPPTQTQSENEIVNPFSDASSQYEPMVQENIDLGLQAITGGFIGKGIIKLNELFSIFIYYDPQTSRFSRFLTLYVKLIVMFAISSIPLNQINTAFWILFTIFMGEFSLFFIKIVKAELGGTLFQKLLGMILALILLLVGWVMLINTAVGMKVSDAEEWAFNFIIAYLINMFVIDPIMVILKIFFYPWSLRQIYGNNLTPIVYLVFFLMNQADLRTYYQL